VQNILILNSSVLADQSASRILVEEAAARLATRWPAVSFTRRDLGTEPIPHLTAENVEGVRGEPRSHAEYSAREVSDELLAELRAADAIVMGVPMYNFGMSTGLKAWFDYILRAGESFSYSEEGLVGLIQGKKVFAILTSGGIYAQGTSVAHDFRTGHLRHLLGFMGIDDVTLIRAEGLAYGPDMREAAIESAIRDLEALFGRAFDNMLARA
jgi:FMN-dependent NADH-azoreductase